MSDQTHTLAAANAYADYGWPTFPVNANKRPAITDWRNNATTDTDQIKEWWDNTSAKGIGTLTGQRSDLWVLDIDVSDGKQGATTLAALTDKYGPLPATVACRTGSGGLHIYFAWNQDFQVTNGLARHLGPGIDVRGEGGYVVAPPSPHQTGEKYRWVEGKSPDQVVIAQAPHWLIELLFPTTDEHEDEAPTRPVASVQGGDSIAAWVNKQTTWSGLLEPDGWSSVRFDPNGDVYWIRPGKTETQDHAHSAIEHPSGVLNIFSTDESIKRLWTDDTDKGDCAVLTRYDYVTITKYNGDRSECARDQRRKRNAEASNNVETALQGVQSRTAPSNSTESAKSQTGGFDESAALPVEFWDERPVFQHIKQAAESRCISPDAVLGAVLAHAGACIHHDVVIPAIVTSPGSLNLIHALVGGSGEGKSGSADTAAELMRGTPRPSRSRFDVPVGSGEGIISAYITDVPVDEGSKRTERKQTIYNILFSVDEVDQLSAQADRTGSTLMATLRTAWSGGMLGQSNATAERTRRLEANGYRFAAIVGVQPDKAGGLLSDAAGGTPQRFVWFTLHGADAKPPEEWPDWPGPLDWNPMHHSRFPIENGHRVISVPERIQMEIKRNRVQRKNRVEGKDIGDSHHDFARIKLAALLAVLDERININDDDWRLSDTIARTSKQIYQAMGDNLTSLAAERQRVATLAATHKQNALVGNKEALAIERAIQGIEKKIRREGQPITKKEARNTRSGIGKKARFAVAVEEGMEQGRLVVKEALIGVPS